MSHPPPGLVSSSATRRRLVEVLSRCEIHRLVKSFSAFRTTIPAIDGRHSKCAFASPTATGLRADEIVENHGRKKALFREIGPCKIKHLHAENDTFARCFYGNVRKNDPFKIKHLRDNDCLKTRRFLARTIFLTGFTGWSGSTGTESKKIGYHHTERTRRFARERQSPGATLASAL